MSDGYAEGPQEDPALPIGQAERASANFEAVAERSQPLEACKVQEKLREAAITQAAQRDVADLVNRNDAYIQQALETAQSNAKLRANQARMFTPEWDESNVLREHLLRERKSASSVTFGLVIASILVLIGLIAGGVYYFSSQNNGNNNSAGGVTPGVVAEGKAPVNSDRSKLGSQGVVVRSSGDAGALEEREGSPV